jgi:hypothetical protein
VTGKTSRDHKRALQVVATPASEEIPVFLDAVATVLRETVATFEVTVARITEITAMRSGRPDRDLVVALQDFDRLQQEFASLSEVIARLAATGDTPTSVDAIAAIPIADLRTRLTRRLRLLSMESSRAEIGEDVVF